MIQDCCPIPSKKLRTLLSPDSSDNEDLNLSSSFDETYKNLMKEEMVAICLKQFNPSNNIYSPNTLSEFYNKCDDLQVWIGTIIQQNRRQSLCRCDLYLEKICHSRQLLQSSRFGNIKMLSKVLISREPHLQDTVNSKIQLIENQWHSKGLFSDLTICHIIDDINEDIADLSTWLGDIKQKLNFDIASLNRKRDIEQTEYILRDFEVHNEICLSVTKVINELQEVSSRSLYYDRISMSKSHMDCLQSVIYEQWLTAIEYKLRLDDPSKEVHQLPYGLPGTIGQESGFESEFSPMYSARRMCGISNAQVMKYISSGDDITDCITDIPSDSQSTDISINIAHLSSSTSDLSTGTMPETWNISFIPKGIVSSPKRIIRRKKRSKRIDKTNQYNLSTEESENCWQKSEKCTLKRRINESSKPQWPDDPINHVTGLNYLEIARAAEILVRKNSSRAEYLIYESAKESEVEDLLDSTRRSPNDIDVEKNWDYYQASMYSNEEGDSQMMEIDGIKNWEPEQDTDEVEVAIAAKISEKRLSILTSGYETNMESDPTICSKNLICVLQFTNKYYQDVVRIINEVTDHIDEVIRASFDSSLNTLTECNSKAEINLKLIRHILNYDSCSIAHNTKLLDNLKIMESQWDRVQNRCTTIQLNLIEGRIKSFDNYRDVEGLKDSIVCIRGLVTVLRFIKSTINSDHIDTSALGQRIQMMEETLIIMKEVRSKELSIVLRSAACVAQSKCTRRLFSCEVRLSKEEGVSGNIDVTDLYDKFEKCIFALKQCMEDVNTITSPECQAYVSTTIDQEIRSWKRLCDRSNCSITPLSNISAEEIESLQLIHGHVINDSPRGRLFRHLPFHMAIVVVVAMIGWWYSQSSTSDCHSSSSIDWIRFFYRYKDHIEPH